MENLFKWMIWGYHHFGKHPHCDVCCDTMLMFFFLQNLRGEWFQWTFFCWETKKIIRNHFELSTLWFWGFWHSLDPHLVGKYIIPGDPPNRSPKDSQGSHADIESDRSTAFLPIVDHSKDPHPSGYHAWLWNLWSLDGGTSLISQAKHAVESTNFNPLLLNSHQGLYSKSWAIFREKKVPDNRVRSLS